KINSFAEYYNYVLSDKTGEALTEMINKITTNYTYFMREPKHFDFLKDTALPYFIKQKNHKELRIWSAGCSSGEEAYTIAMVIQDYMKTINRTLNAKILATDISNKALSSAQQAEYIIENIDSLPLNWRTDYFKISSEGKCVVDDQIKSMIRLAYLNLMDLSLPFKKKFQVIFCRNVMIYFDSKSKDDLVERFYDALEPGGYLFIGHSEALNRERTKFKYIMPAIYRKEI
ncbi:MAG: protein-glutamate O-methyltransferase CheR, partial [Oscillospiraceae bacterium]